MSIVLDKQLWFPDPRQARNLGSLNGFVAIGGDLSVERLLLAYRNGIFPWSIDPITWWSPDPRGVLQLDQFHASRSLQRLIRRGQIRPTMNLAFRAVMEGCAALGPGRTVTWISPEFIVAYEQLHRAGWAHSVECWLDGNLVGGVYGVQIGAFFAGESMFHTVPDASKIALFHLVEHLRQQKFTLFDVQMVTPHTSRLGAQSIAREEYLQRLQAAVRVPCKF